MKRSDLQISLYTGLAKAMAGHRVPWVRAAGGGRQGRRREAGGRGQAGAGEHHNCQHPGQDVHFPRTRKQVTKKALKKLVSLKTLFRNYFVSILLHFYPKAELQGVH